MKTLLFYNPLYWLATKECRSYETFCWSMVTYLILLCVCTLFMQVTSPSGAHYATRNSWLVTCWRNTWKSTSVRGGTSVASVASCTKPSGMYESTWGRTRMRDPTAVPDATKDIRPRLFYRYTYLLWNRNRVVHCFCEVWDAVLLLTRRSVLLRTPCRCISGPTATINLTCVSSAWEASGRKVPLCDTFATTPERSLSNAQSVPEALLSTGLSIGTCARKV